MDNNNTLIVAPGNNGNGLRKAPAAVRLDARDDGDEPLGDVRGSTPLPEEDKPKRLVWRVERGAGRNYRALGKRLNQAGDLHRNGDDHGLIQVLPSGRSRLITKASELAPIIVDRVTMRVIKNAKVVSELPTATHQNAMLRSEKFLRQFLRVREVTNASFYLDDFSLVQPGYNEASQVLYLGEATPYARSTETINAFLDVMQFESNADRTNTIGASLTVLLRRQWPGEKPVVLITSEKSHSGKGTVTEFTRGNVSKADILYESIDWPMQSQFQKQVQMDSDIGMLVFDNVRLDSSGSRSKFIRSGFVESFVTSPEVVLASPGAGEPIRLQNRYVVTINMNDGMLSPDLMNRSLSIHLAPRGDVHERDTPIGNPKLEFLPQNRDRIEAELRGMIETWKEAGCPLDHEVRHPMTPWARTIGGILKVSGFSDFLANYGTRKSADDPIREALAILGACRPNKPLRPMQWAKLAVEQGLAKTLFSVNERDTEKGRERAIGVLLKHHCEIRIEAKSETTRYSLRLKGGFRRWIRGKNPHTRYLFTVMDSEDIQVDGEPIELKVEEK